MKFYNCFFFLSFFFQKEISLEIFEKKTNKICEILNRDKSIKIYWHPEHDVPYAYKPGLWIGYDNLESIINKVKYVKSMNLGGVIVW